MKNLYKYIALAFAPILISGCNDYLDPNEYSVRGEEQIFNVTTYVNNLSAAIYSTIPDPAELGMSRATDEGDMVNTSSSFQLYNTGAWNKNNNPDNVWASCYNGIRMACDMLAGTDTLTWASWRYSFPTKYVDLIRKLNTGRAEAHFLRAYLYFELIKRYGDVPLITDKENVSANMDISKFKRTPVADIISYICDECDIVCREGKYYLSPEEIAQRTNNGRNLLETPYRDTLDVSYPTTGDLSQYLGRATRASAYALKAKALIYFASKLFNPDNDIDRWKNAAAACAKVINLPSSDYGLESSYESLFNKKSAWSKEFLFVRKMSASNSFEKTYFPVSIEGGGTGICPSQNLVDAYEVLENNGKTAVDFDWSNPAHSAAPYAHRDPRFAATIYKHGDQYNAKVNTIVLDCSEGGNSGLPIYHATTTGYYLKKYVNSVLNLNTNQKDTKTFILMRMADFYLYYAEAMNEAYGPDDAADLGMTARQALNKIRKRAGMPDVVASDQDTFREKVYHEREVELAFENARWWDVRRWKRGQVFNVPLRGVDVSSTGAITPKTVEERVFDESKMYLYPIPQTEMDKAGSVLTQNPNW
jgi:hypothetical protein